MKDIFLIFIGGGLGSLSRFGFAKVLNPLLFNFPLGTFASNVVSSFILGFTIAMISSKNIESSFYTSFVIIGICGGFSTFSGFSMETLNLIKSESYMYAGLNILLNVSICIFSIIGGMKLSQIIYN